MIVDVTSRHRTPLLVPDAAVGVLRGVLVAGLTVGLR